MIAPNLPGHLLEGEEDHPCVAPGDFKGMAFISDVLDGIEGPPGDVPTSAETAITEIAPTTKDTSTSTSPSTPTMVPSSTTSSSVSGISVSQSEISDAGPSSTPSISPVPTSRAATIADGTLFMKLGLCLFFLVTMM
ncbi:hypothetical protein F4776DRAFT_600211 [Hypoxylon sp. NC0597]|nr:hypothetical protein F4776DRAFT_600211 [Hypoxylon sp. NC0597]